MATKTLAQKLYIRPGYTVALLNAPKGAAALLDPLPEDVQIVTNTKEKVNLVLCFVKSSADLEKAGKGLKEQLDEDVVLWFAYPKKSGKTKSDLSRDQGWKPIYDLGYQGVASISIDDTWSGVRFKRGLAKSVEEAVAKQYSGERAAFLPLFETLSRLIQTLGPDVEIVARQSYIAFSRGKHFALLMPARDHLDLVLKLPSNPMDPRLLPVNGLGSGTMTHRIPITDAEQVDKDVIGWIQDAYRAARG